MNIKSRWRQKWVCPSSCFNCISLQKYNQWIECHVLLRRSLCYCEMSNNSVVLGESVHVFKLCYLFTISVTWPYTTWNKGNWSTSIDGSGSKQLFNKRYRVLFIKLKSTITTLSAKLICLSDSASVKGCDGLVIEDKEKILIQVKPN